MDKMIWFLPSECSQMEILVLFLAFISIYLFQTFNNGRNTLVYLLFSLYEHFIMPIAHYGRLTLDIENHTAYT